jgi:hypothetical protein
MTAKTIFVEHPDSHAPTAKQLKDAGVDPDEATSYVNESGVGTTYTFEDSKKAAPSGSGQTQPA